ncbi:hypothetical protein PV327_006672 [Microctonus hyperodae]|uniref:PWWP domain-containing protein n=1 Tax=Microctonus hyperodae TaxID=165561 RepID=A0AA39F4X2_MICHY|nr:hypothetical protein PV327_006672 [Microctonus hyperodae]
MVKLMKKFLPGDKVFAKVRGYPPWPARVENVTDPNTKSAKYKVYFYGTSETAVCKVDELFDYHDNKEKFGKPMKRKLFHQGIQQLEQELNKDLGKSTAFSESAESVVEESETENNPTPLEPSTGVNLDSDLETGPLVIDETDKKKPLKRKSVLGTPLNSDTPEIKKKRGRKSMSTSILEAGNDSQGEETIGKEVVSRSGRKIKPKRFADFSADDEYDIDTMGRGRGKSKHDETNENIPTPSSGVGKKRMSIEKDDKKIINKDINNQKHKIRWYRIEAQLLTLDAQIKSNLGLEQADTDKCLQAMDDMLGLSVDPLMLKKHPQIVETVKRLRRYVGNLVEWKLSDDEVEAFQQKALEIRKKAEHIYNKFKALFTIAEGQSFWIYFSDQVDQFKDVTKNMSENEFFSLITDPTTDLAATQDVMSGDESVVLGERSVAVQERSSDENSPTVK